MGVAKKTRKFAQTKRVLGRRDERLKPKTPAAAAAAQSKAKAKETPTVQNIPQAPSHLFFQANEALVPPYNVLLDTNFFAHSVRNKLDIQNGLMDLLYAKCQPIVTDCVMAELEKLGPKYRLALRVARDERWQRLNCAHSGTYADDCLVELTQKHRIYLVGTNDKQLRQRLRKIPGVPLIAVGRGKYTIERLPDAAL